MRNRRNRDARGKLEIPVPVLKTFVKEFDRFDFLLEDTRFGSGESDPVYVEVRKFQLEELEHLQKLLEKANPKPAGTIAQVSMHMELMKKPQGRPIKNLPGLETALRAYIKEKIIQGWLFMKLPGREKLQPMLVTSVKYFPPRIQGGSRYPARTTLRMEFWEKNEADSKAITWEQEDLAAGKDLETLLSDEGLIKETRALIDSYLRDEEQFLQWRKKMGCQFLATGTFEAKVEDDNSRGWHDTRDRQLNSHRVVVDDRCETIKQRKDTDLFNGQDLEDDDEVELTESELTAASVGYTRVPVSFFIWCFNLETHEEGWVHMYDLKPYVYRPEVKDKLILSPEHSDLIDALTSDRDVLMEDIVSGKSGGTTIILQGKAGTGKTLTAEVYAEVMKVPLYRVHSGQLGIEPESVENVLKESMKRANRWNCALLIDECDVFLRARGDSLEHNAIVGVFLRVLEYFNGLLFLTTNRVDELDEAILSRAIANIKFNLPGEAERARLWKTLGEVFQVKLLKEDKACQRLAKDLQCSGRDIKGLIRLAVKYSRQRKKVLTVEDIKRMAIFKGL